MIRIKAKGFREALNRVLKISIAIAGESSGKMDIGRCVIIAIKRLRRLGTNVLSATAQHED